MRNWLEHIRWLFRERNFPGFLAAIFVSGLALSFVLPFLSLWGTKSAGFSAFQFGLLMTGSALCGVALALVFGRLSDTRLSRRTVLLLGSGCGSVGYTGFALISDQWLLLTVAVTFVAGASTCFSQFFATARSWFDGAPEHASRLPITLSVVRVCYSISGAIGPPIAAQLVTRYGFSGLFLAVAGLHTIVFACVWRFAPSRQPSLSANSARTVSIAHSFRRPEVLGHFVALTLIASAFTMSTLNLPLAIAGHMGGTAHDVGLAFGLSPLVEIPLTLWFGYLASRGHVALLLRIGAVVSALYFLLLFLADAIWQIYLIQVLSGASFAILTNVAIVSVQNLMPDQPGLATAIFGNSGTVGKLVGYFTFGMLARPIGPTGLFGVCAGLAALASLIFFMRRLQGSSRIPATDPTLSGARV